METLDHVFGRVPFWYFPCFERDSDAQYMVPLSSKIGVGSKLKELTWVSRGPLKNGQKTVAEPNTPSDERVTSFGTSFTYFPRSSSNGV